MSALARTALRLASVQALLADPVIMALCATRVYDSRIDSLSESEPVPLIVVLTEEMEGEAWSPNNGGPPFDDHCELLIEISYRASVQQDDAEPVIGVAESDAETEMTIDLIEQRAVDALNHTALVRHVTRRITKQRSQRYVDPDSAVKMAQRLITLTVQLKGDDTPATVLTSPVVGATAAEDNTGNGVLTLAAPAADNWVIKGAYAVTFTSETAFLVTDPNANPAGSGVCGAPFERQVRFSIAVGETPFAEGDSFTLAVSQGPYAALPDPLRAVCEAMADGSYGQGICNQLAAAIGSPSPIEFFTGAGLTVAPQTGLSRELAPIGAPQRGTDPSYSAPIGGAVEGADPSFQATADIPPDC